MTEDLEFDRVRALSKLLEERRKELGLTQLQVGEKTGLSQQFVSTSERLNPGSGVRFFEMLKLLQFYHLDPNEAAKVVGLSNGKE